MNKVDAVVVKRYSADSCPNCDQPLFMIRQDIELGAVFTVDLDTKRIITVQNRSHGIEYQTEVVDDMATGHWVPTDVLMSGGNRL